MTSISLQCGARPVRSSMTRPQTAQASHRIALLFNANKVYDREVITGIGNYLLSTRVAWDLFLEEDFRCRLNGIERFEGDGIIADFDDPAVAEALGDSQLPVVAVVHRMQTPHVIRPTCLTLPPITPSSCHWRTPI